MEQEKREISNHEFFSIVKELLAQHRPVIFNINGYSMLPFLGSRRDQVMLEACDRKSLKIGDVILYQYRHASEEYMLHRIYQITKNGYRTMGDGNDFMDEEITPDQVVGIVTKIYRKGKETDCRSKKWKITSGIWRWLKPVRRPLIGIYRRGSSIKRK